VWLLVTSKKMKFKIAKLTLHGTLVLGIILISSLCSLAQAALGKVGAEQSIALSPREQQFITSMAPLKVMVDDDFMPLSRYDKATGAYEGISVDLFRQLAARLGLKYELLYSANLSWGAKVELFKQRKIDLLMPVSFTAERAEVGAFTRHFYETYYVVIAKKSRHIQLKESSGLTSYKIGATKASAILAFIKPLVPASQIVIYDSQALLYQAVRKGDVDVALQNKNVFAEDRFNLEFFDLEQIHTITESPRKYAYYLTQTDAHLQLASILDRQLVGADLNELRTRYERGEDELVKRYVEQKQHKQQLLWGIAGTSTVLVLLAALYLNHRRLSKRLLASLQQSQQQQAELRHSEEKFRAIADCTVNLEIWWGLDNKLLWINPAVLTYTGYSAAECMNMTDFFGTLIDPQDLREFKFEVQLYE
jgi:ABC-type amino acid transport substrate-binding protein